MPFYIRYKDQKMALMAGRCPIRTTLYPTYHDAHISFGVRLRSPSYIRYRAQDEPQTQHKAPLAIGIQYNVEDGPYKAHGGLRLSSPGP